MQKTWRLSDILILLILLIMGLLVYWQMVEAKRLYERVNTAVEVAEDARTMQIEVLENVATLQKTVSRLKAGTVVIENGSSGKGGDDGSTGDVPDEQKYGDTIIRRCPTKIRTLNPLT